MQIWELDVLPYIWNSLSKSGTFKDLIVASRYCGSQCTCKERFQIVLGRRPSRQSYVSTHRSEYFPDIVVLDKL